MKPVVISCVPVAWAVALVTACAWAQAQVPAGPAAPQPSAARPGEGDASLGARIAGLGLPQKGVAACASCHGPFGEGQAASGFPRIAGQSAAYLEQQLQNYTQGVRQHPVMGPIASSLDAAQQAAVAAHYAALRPAASRAAPQGAGRAPPAGRAPAPQSARGRLLATQGDERIQVQACANCHGPGGGGQPPAFPYLAGQHEAYLKATLQAWHSGQRRGDASGQMAAIAQRLSASDVAAVSAYYAALPPASIASIPHRTPQAARPSPTGTGGGTAPPSGTGTEQGAPLTGGGQGPGGGGATQQRLR